MSYFKLRKDLTTKMNGIDVYRVQLTEDCRWGKAGDIGGWVSNEENVGLGWVAKNACVYQNAKILSPVALVTDRAILGGTVTVLGKTVVGGEVIIDDNSHIYGNTIIKHQNECYRIHGFKMSIFISPDNIQVGRVVWNNLEAFEKTCEKELKEYDYTEDEIQVVMLLVRTLVLRMDTFTQKVSLIDKIKSFLRLT